MGSQHQVKIPPECCDAHLTAYHHYGHQASQEFYLEDVFTNSERYLSMSWLNMDEVDRAWHRLQNSEHYERILSVLENYECLVHQRNLTGQFIKP